MPSTTPQKTLGGIIAAVPTPFTADGSQVDVDNIHAQVERLVKAGIHGVVTTGTTGEFPALTPDEHKLVVKTYVEAARGRIPVVAGVGANSTRAAIDFVQHAQSVGAAAVMVVPPFYDPLDFDSLVAFYKDVTASIDIPLMYYNLPHATGVHLKADEIRTLGSIKGLDYLKDTSGNAKEQVDLLTNPPADVTVFNGWDTLTFSSMALGAKGGVWGVASIVPDEAAEFWETFAVKGDLVKAREQWKFLWAVSSFLESVNYAAGIKAGLDIVGFPAGPTRAPTQGLGSKDIERFRQILAQRKHK